MPALPPPPPPPLPPPPPPPPAAKLTLRNLRLTGVESSDAGAVALDMGASLEAFYCDFSKNKAAAGAGLSVRDPDTSAALHFCTLWENSADGGAPQGPACGLVLQREGCCVGHVCGTWQAAQHECSRTAQGAQRPRAAGATRPPPSPPPRAGNGGAVAVSSGSLSITNCTFTRNDAMYGGGIALDSSALLNAGACVCVQQGRAGLRARARALAGAAVAPGEGRGGGAALPCVRRRRAASRCPPRARPTCRHLSRCTPRFDRAVDTSWVNNIPTVPPAAPPVSNCAHLSRPPPT